MRSVLFLDCDGVMNTNNHDLKAQGGYVSWPDTHDHPCRDQFQNNGGFYNPGWTKEAIEGIREIYATCNCDIVMSSTWRFDLPLSKFDEYLGLHEGSVVGRTLDLSGSICGHYPNERLGVVRGMEILTFLSMNYPLMLDTNYVVVDDCLVAVPDDRFVLTYGQRGLVKNDVEKIKATFAKGNRQ